MLLAQAVDQVAASSAGAFAEKFGFPALLVVILLVGIWKMNQAHREERKERDALDEKRELGRREERREDRTAHLEALGKHTEAVTTLGQGMVRLEAKVDNLDRDVTELKGRAKD